MTARLLILAAGLALAACQTTKAPVAAETAAGLTLPPMAEPEEPTVGYAVVVKSGEGSQVRYELVSLTDKTMTWRSSSGCEWLQSRAYDRRFAPAIEWRACNGSSGTLSIEARSGDPEWPLVVGKRWRYRATGYGPQTWNGDQDCEVAGTARITTASGTHDTYKVVCTSQWATYTRYFAPALGAMVRYQRERLAGGVTNEESDLVRIEKPAGS